ELEPRMRFVKVDTEQQSTIAARYAIRSIPTLMVFKQGKLVNQINGSLPKSMFKQWLEQFMDV
ncbi:thioredoxin domain-containing protein, partial [Aeromonas veronii]